MLDAAWQPAPFPKEEQARLLELKKYHILDTPPDVAFDRLTSMAAQRFSVPIALVSFVDYDRQWFKSHHGLDVTQTPRDLAFCAHAILNDDVFVVRDTIYDPRFANHPLVIGSPHIRFYAGAPLTTSDGYKLGTVCVIDRVPHPDFSDNQKKELAELASIAVDEMELRLAAYRAQHDVEELKKIQKEVEVEREKAETAAKEKMHLIATISHELRTPMNGILGMAYLLRDTGLDKMQKEYIDTINHSANNLLLLINDVLDLSKIEAQQLTWECEPFDIKTNFIQTLKMLQPLANKKGNSLVYEIAANVPDTIMGDRGRFAQVVTNLMGNAVKFTDRGRVEAKLSYNEKTHRVRCDIIDNGIGIPAAKHKQLFVKFTQGDPSITQKYGGTGLGLAITKHLVVMLGGTIGFKSQENVGSQFWFELPVANETQKSPLTPVKSHTVSRERMPVSAARVLVAEDNMINQLFLVALLKKFGFKQIDVVENGVEVMESIRQNRLLSLTPPYDFIFMDCKMPLQDGLETTRLIRKEEKDIPASLPMTIIAMTANALTGDREICLNSGMDDYLSKPIQPELLKNLLKNWLIFPPHEKSLSDRPLKKYGVRSSLDLARVALVATTEPAKARFYGEFFRMAENLIEIMGHSRRDEEFVRWKHSAHSLKGAGANLGMTGLVNLCLQAEKAEEFSYQRRSDLLRQIQEEIETIKDYVSQTTSPQPINERTS